PDRSCSTSFGWRSSPRCSTCPASAARSRFAVRWTVSPSGTSATVARTAGIHRSVDGARGPVDRADASARAPWITSERRWAAAIPWPGGSEAMTAVSDPAAGAERTARRLDAVEHRIDTVIARYAPYAGLAIGLALTPPFLAGGPAWPWLVIGLLLPATVAWCAVFTAGAAPRARHPVAGAVYLCGLLASLVGLVYASPLFGFQVLAVYLHAFAFLRGHWRFAAVVAGAAVVSYSQVGGRFAEFTPGLAAGMAVLTVANALLGGGGTYLGVFMSQQSTRRREIIDELGATTRRLSEALEENASLHAQLLAQAREAGMLDERARLAREIHDTIAQGL